MQIVSQFARYFVVGLLNTALDFLIFNALSISFNIYSGVAIIPLNVVTASVVIIQSYLLNKYWTFKSVFGSKRVEFSKFILVNFGAMIVNTSIVYALTTHAAPEDVSPLAWENVAKGVALIANIIWNFLGFKFFVFRESPDARAYEEVV